ncbi:prostaglandin reductase 1-like [Schistocerca gregaria]|uniref:prostaglandin reductase 1-like n=1 Tax=Schistocerca gregaria TaxID=7010 RepID=UPI00211DDF27|nr:prostaglandin reductase 1-like [Schistocerca gregaria]
MTEARKIVIAKRFEGEPKVTDFRVETERLPALQDGQMLCETTYISVDPYQRVAAIRLPIGSTMVGSQLSRIVESRAPGYAAGQYVVGFWGWRDRTVVTLADTGSDILPPMLVPDYGDLPMSLSLGVFGMPGATAYFGLLDICDPKPGETLVVSGAAGAVGSIVGQIARIKGCKVIGIAGSDAKVKWLKEELGFDEAINYKTSDVEKAVASAAPSGVDAYFDNVGGAVSQAVLGNMRPRGRVCLCGSISTYNQDSVPTAPVAETQVQDRQLRMEWIKMSSRWGRRDGAFAEMAQWIREGKLKYRETVTDGFEKAPQAFVGMMNGENLGKAVVKV